MGSNYPEEFIRGVPRDDPQFITPEGYAMQSVFKFDDYDATERCGDGLCELSVNWVDDEGAISALLEQVNARKGCFQFAGGYFRLATSDVDFIRGHLGDGDLTYERKPRLADESCGVTANPYHGNLLIRNELSKHVKTNIQSALASLAGTVVRRG